MKQELRAATGLRLLNSTARQRRPFCSVIMSRVKIRIRLQSRQQRLGWPIRQWRHVMFSDKSRFDLLTVISVCGGDMGRDTDVTISFSIIPMMGEALWYEEVFPTIGELILFLLMVT